MRRMAVFSITFIIILSFRPLAAQNAWTAKDGSVGKADLKAAIASSDSLYIATRNALYKAADLKERWESIFSLPAGGDNEINCLAGRAKILYIGTKKGLFRSGDYGASWKNVFKTILPDRNNITYIELSRYSRSRVLIATDKGVYLSEDYGEKWQNISGILSGLSVKCLALNKESMYAGTEAGLYVRRADSEDWERVFVRSSPEKSAGEEVSGFIDPEEEADGSIRCIAISDGRVYTAFLKEIVYSDDNSKTWMPFVCEGLAGSINYILVSPKDGKLYCATSKGVFEYSTERSGWFELYKGMTKSLNVNKLIFAQDEKVLLAVTDKGLYAFETGDYLMDKYPDIENSVKTLKTVFDGEPTYKELQMAAIKHAEVSPEKIKAWRAGAQARALFPKVSVSLDRNRSDTYDIYTSATKDYVITGPDDTSDGWNLGLSWDIGNLIWSDDQTNIDVRSRLMVQLRNDILDDLRRVYYERKRLQFELMTNPPKDMNVKFEKELRLQELTQGIDDLTGNYFSEHIRKR